MADPSVLKTPASPPAPWVIVCGGFNPHGGMDKANLALAEYLLVERRAEVHLVGHEIDAVLGALPGARSYPVPRPRGLVAVAEGLLDRRGRIVARAVVAADPHARVVVNGGNCAWDDINWVHYVHHAWEPEDRGAPLLVRLNNRRLARLARRHEQLRVPPARIVVSNSQLTTRQLVETVGVDPTRVHTLYLGADSTWGPPSDAEIEAGRRQFGSGAGRPIIVFLGALGYDDRKGFDTLLTAWERLCAREDWDADLVAAGGGRGVERWRAEVRRRGLEARVRLAGFVRDVPGLLAAADLLVSPVRYEPYGLNVQEALCRGVPALVSASAGIAERYPPEAGDLILRNPDDPAELSDRLLHWHSNRERWQTIVAPMGERLRARSWREMARDFVELVDADREAA